MLEFARPLPAPAIIPPAILFFGLTNKMALAVIAFGAVWPVLLASVHGFSSIEPQLLEVSAALRLSRLPLLWKVAPSGGHARHPGRGESEPGHCPDSGGGDRDAGVPDGVGAEHPARAALAAKPG